MLEIKNLKVKTNEKNIIDNLNLKINDGEIHVLMGSNGAGKSTICKTILHHPDYEVVNGRIFYNNEDITNMETGEIAKRGIYYINQSPIEVEGVTNIEVLRTALNEKEKKVNIFELNKECNQVCEKLDVPKSFIHREVNVGMSGGERKKNELFGMWILSPSLVLLDEIDSGLDVDALKLVGNTLKEYQEKSNASILVITHQEKLIEILKPHFVHILKDGKIIKTGNIDLARKVLKEGFSGSNIISKEQENE